LKYYLGCRDEIYGFFVFILHMQEILRTDLTFPKKYAFLEKVLAAQTFAAKTLA
jgi:hypothetical protein